MNRRDFIKNSLLVIGGASCLTCGSKILYDYNEETSLDGVKLSEQQLKYRYKSKKDLPRSIFLDACTLCQLNCPRCYMRMYPEKVKKGFGLGYLKFKNFKKLVDNNNFKRIELANNGEMFLNPELPEIVKYAFYKNINLHAIVGVNLNYLTDEMAEALVKYQFRQITVSIDGATPKTYAIYRRGGDFNTVINNVKKINYFKKKYNSQYPILTYKFILFGHNEHEIDQAKDLAKKLDMEMLFMQNFDKSYSPVKNKELIKQKTGVDTSFSQREYIATMYQKDHKQYFFCKDLWATPHVNWDGRIVTCCDVQNEDFGGNAFKDGLLKALNNSKILYAKSVVAENVKPIAEIPCSTCIIHKLVTKMNLKIKPQDLRGDFWV